MNWRRVTILAVIGSAVLLGLSGCSRYAQLGRVVDLNVGYMHATRGCSQETVNALRGRVTEKDVPLLVRMLDDRDHVKQVTAAFVLARIRPEGIDALRVEFQKVKESPVMDVEKWDAINEALHEAERVPTGP